jgi:MFS family permease
MQTVPLVASCVGMACGGLFADLMYDALGPRWGRAIPIASVLFLCAVTYFVATLMPTAWGVVAALAVMAFLVDLGVPSIWAFAQDVGGRQAGAALGFGNMLGNFGAAASPVALQLIRKEFGWDVAFLTCAGCFVLAGTCGLNLNALIPVARETPDPQAEDYRELDNE